MKLLSYLQKDIFLFYIHSRTFLISLIFILGASSLQFFLYPKNINIPIEFLIQDLFLIFFFVGIFSVFRNIEWEYQNSSFRMIHFSTLSYTEIYITKVISNFIFMLSLMICLYITFLLFFNWDLKHLIKIKQNLFFFIGIHVLLLFCFASLGTICSTISVFSNSNYLMYFTLFIPLMIPVFILTIYYIQGVLENNIDNLGLFMGFSLFYFSIGFLFYEYLLEE